MTKGKVFLALFAVSLMAHLYAAHAQEITVRNDVDFSFMDPAQISNYNDYRIAANIYSGLLRFNLETFEPEPDLAKSWEVSPDGLTYTFHLRDNVQWHKGYGKFTARDVKYSLERIMDPKTKSRFRIDFANVDRVEVVGDYTAKIHMKAPDMSFVRKVLYYRPGYIVNQKAIETLGSKYNSSPVGTGPFIFDRWEPGSKVILVANKDYFLGPPKLKKITFLVINEEAVAQMALETGDLDIAVFRTFELRESLKKNSQVVNGKILLQEPSGLGLTYVIINNCRKPFDDTRVRQAIHHAINKDALIAVAFAGVARKAASVLAPGYFGYKSNVKVYDFNPDRAKRLLAEAGFPNGFESAFLYYPGPPWRQYAPIIQEQLRQVGIRLKLTMLDRATVEQIRRKGNFDLLYGSLSRPPDPDIIFSTFYDSWNAPFPNMACYKNKEVDTLIAQGNRERDTEKRKKIYYRIQDIIAEETPVLPINYDVQLVAMKSYVKGYTYNDLMSYLLRDVYIEGKK